MEYFLDGKKVSPDSIKGKSGHLVIRWTYKNKQKVTKLVNGSEKELYVPFMAASAAVLSTDRYLNVEVTNGKILSDGEKLIVVGMAFPGLQDSLDFVERPLGNSCLVYDIGYGSLAESFGSKKFKRRFKQ